MTKKFTAALCALLVAASTLAVVAQPAAAHSQTTTKQRCSYDPFAGQQCWTETVNVSHTHACGAGMTGTYPNCYPIPPANQNCGAGTTGTFPNCYPIPPDNTNNNGDDDSGGDDGGSTEPDSTDTDSTDTGTGTDTDSTDTDGTDTGTGTDTDGTDTDTDGTDTDSTDTGTGTGTTYTGNSCSPYQGSLRTYQRHRHPIGDSSTDSGCHRHDDSHCSAGHTETGGHGSQNCRKNDAPDNLATRIQYLLEKGTAAALDAVIEALQNEAADRLNQLDEIDWENLHTDGDSQEKLVQVLNPLLESNNLDPVTLNDLRDLADVWTSLHDDVRTAGATAGCYAATAAALAATKGKIAKKPKVLAELLISVGCAIGERRIPDGSNGDSPADDSPAGDNADDNADDQDADDNADDQDADDNADDQDAADEGSAGNYCGPWTASAWRPDRGAVTLFVNGAPYSEVQSSYGNREWAAARCQAVLASLGQ